MLLSMMTFLLSIHGGTKEQRAGSDGRVAESLCPTFQQQDQIERGCFLLVLMVLSRVKVQRFLFARELLGSKKFLLFIQLIFDHFEGVLLSVDDLMQGPIWLTC